MFLNEPSKMIFWCLVKQLMVELIWFSENDFCIWLGKQLLSKLLSILFVMCKTNYLVNHYPIFDNTEPSCRIKKNLWSCSLELEKLLNFTSLTLEFHNFNQALCRSFMIPVYQVLQILEESMVKINHDLKIPCQYHRNHVPYAFQILSYSIHIPME